MKLDVGIGISCLHFSKRMCVPLFSLIIRPSGKYLYYMYCVVLYSISLALFVLSVFVVIYLLVKNLCLGKMNMVMVMVVRSLGTAG